MPARRDWDLSHVTQEVSEIGRLQYFMRIPVLPTDVISVNSAIHYILSPFRRRMPWDAVVTTLFFFVPYRHTYPNLKAAIIDGHDENVSGPFTTRNISHQMPSLLFHHNSTGTQLTHIQNDYVSAWNRFFRDDQLDEITTSIFNDEDVRMHGYPVCHLPTYHTTLRGRGDHSLDANDKQMILPTSGATTSLNVEEFSYFLSEYKSERKRELYGGEYYDQVMKAIYGSNVNIDADQRPLLLGVDTQYLSGQTIRGTDEATLGIVRGVSEGMISTRLKKTFIPEHGTLYGAIVLRYPPLWNKEHHFFDANGAGITFQSWSGEEYTEVIRPDSLSLAELFADSNQNSNVPGEHPHNTWYRTHVNHVHPYFDKENGYDRDDGYPILKTPTTTSADAASKELLMINPRTYDKMFHSLQLKHGHFYAHNYVDASRPINVPEPGYMLGGI